jgi:DNA polymerase III epsilon subunit-like protein
MAIPAVISAAHTPKSIVALDCEMIGVGSQSYLARVTIVDYNGDIIVDKFVKPPVLRNTTLRINYRTHVSGVNKDILNARGEPFPRVQALVLNKLRGKTILGHALLNDFKALQIHDWHTRYSYYDTTEIPFFMNMTRREGYPDRYQPRKLKDLALEFLGKTIQVEGAPHDSAEDARAVLDLYKAYPDKFVSSSTQSSPPPLSIGSRHTRKRRTRRSTA